MLNLPKWRLTATAAWKLLFAIIFVLVSSYFAKAQPPIPTPADAIDVPADELADQDVEEVVEAPVVRSEATQAALDAINSRNPELAIDLVNAAVIMQRLGAFPEAESFLDQAIATDMTPEETSELYRKVGTAALVRLATEKALTPKAGDFVRGVFETTEQHLRSPARVAKQIALLGSSDDETRRAAMAELDRIGSHAVPSLLTAMRRPPAGTNFKQLEAALIRLGDDAEAPLIAALGGPDTFAQTVAARVLGVVGGDHARRALIRPFFVGKDNVQPAAAAALKRLGGGLPSTVEASANYLSNEAQRHFKGEPPRQPEFDGTLEMWTWSAEQKNVVANRLTVREASAVAAARAMRDAYELSPSQANTELLLISRLQVDQLLNGVDELLPRGAGSGFEFGASSGVDTVCNVLNACLDGKHKNRLDPAAMGAAELLGQLNAGSGSIMSCRKPLIRALHSSNRRVRYAAARAMMQIDSRTAFSGSSFLLETLLELADVVGTPRAIVATSRDDHREHFAGLLGSLGFNVFRAKDGRSCVAEAVCSSDYDVILLSDSVSRPMANETIQQLRKDPQGKLVPVILLSRESRAARTRAVATMEDYVTVMPEFADEQTLMDRLGEVELAASDHFVPPSRRAEQARDAMSWLAHLGEFSKSYPWYDVMRARDVALRGSAKPALSASATRLLGFLGDEASQKMLVDLASRRTLDAELRQQAANSFGEAVLRHGLMLRRSGVLLQYDRYNASETADKETQEILGQVLDVIETQTRPTSLKSD